MKSTYLFFGIFVSLNIYSQQSNPELYFIPGQGADERLFSNLTIDNDFTIKHIKYFVPERNTSLKEYARQLSSQIDTTQQFVLIGVSLGGMLAIEINEFLDPQKIIIISSAKSLYELPFRYRFQKVVPLYKLFSSRAIKRGASIMQPLVEPDRNNEKEIFINMLADKNKHFMKRSVQMIIKWDRKVYSKNIVHIHGDIDNTIPVKNVNYNYLIDGGSHMITLTRPVEISNIINTELNKLNVSN